MGIAAEAVRSEIPAFIKAQEREDFKRPGLFS
jgi:hypothetical protein